MTSEPVRKTVRKYRAALEHYDVHRDQLGFREPILPLESGRVHAVSGGSPRRGDAPEFKLQPWEAACGHMVHVILPMPFDGADPDSCVACLEAVVKGGPLRVFAEPPCLSTVIPTVSGFSQMVGCQLSQGHPGRHRGEGATWSDGSDFTPSEYAVGDDDDTAADDEDL